MAGFPLLEARKQTQEGSVFPGFSSALGVVPQDREARCCARLRQRLPALCHLAPQHWQKVYLDIQGFIVTEKGFHRGSEGVGTDPRILVSGLPTRGQWLRQENVKCGENSS